MPIPETRWDNNNHAVWYKSKNFHVYDIKIWFIILGPLIAPWSLDGSDIQFSDMIQTKFHKDIYITENLFFSKLCNVNVLNSWYCKSFISYMTWLLIHFMLLFFPFPPSYLLPYPIFFSSFNNMLSLKPPTTLISLFSPR